MRKTHARQGHAPPARKNRKTPQKPAKLLNVTEDADLRYRLARHGFRSSVISAPTAEEAPVSFAAWAHQRSRWIKGDIQTWLVLMRQPFRAAREMGFAAFMSMQLVLGGGLVAAFVHGPLAIIVLAAALSPSDILSTADFVLALFGYCVGMFTALTAAALSGTLSHVRAALTMPLYWPLLTIAAGARPVRIPVEAAPLGQDIPWRFSAKPLLWPSINETPRFGALIEARGRRATAGD